MSIRGLWRKANNGQCCYVVKSWSIDEATEQPNGSNGELEDEYKA